MAGPADQLIAGVLYTSGYQTAFTIPTWVLMAAYSSIGLGTLKFCRWRSRRMPRAWRLEREAQVLAALNHPNIAALYGIEQGAIVMELVEQITVLLSWAAELKR